MVLWSRVMWLTVLWSTVLWFTVPWQGYGVWYDNFNGAVFRSGGVLSVLLAS